MRAGAVVEASSAEGEAAEKARDSSARYRYASDALPARLRRQRAVLLMMLTLCAYAFASATL